MSKSKKSPSGPNTLSLATHLVHGGTYRSEIGEMSESIFMTSGFTYDSAEQAEARFKGENEGFIYSRYGNPTTRMFEERMCALEGAEDARATTSGMSAIYAALTAPVRSGDKVVAAKALFSSTRYILEEILPKFGVETVLVNGSDLHAWESAIDAQTKLVLLETPSNPTLEVYDIKAISDIAHSHDALVIVDNVFATPLYQKPLELGADIVVYSATKHIDGQGRSLGGIILSSQEIIDEYYHKFLRHTGPGLSPFNAWVLLKGLETLEVRVERMCETAGQVADFLAHHSKIKSVTYPGQKNHPHADIIRAQMSAGSTLVAFELKGGQSEAFILCNHLNLFKISNNLGDAKSIITHPTTTTHQSMSEEERLELGITPAVIRLSIGLEAAQDLIADLEQALERI